LERALGWIEKHGDLDGDADRRGEVEVTILK